MKFIKGIIFTAVLAASASLWALEGKVVSVEGKVEVQDGSIWVELDEGDTIEKGAVISTGFKSKAVIEVKGSKFTLGPLTRLTVEDLVSSDDKDSTQVFIDSGTIAADVNGADGKRVGFKVRSPIATASVRGTGFKMSSSGKLAVTSGLVSFGPAESSEPEIAEDAPEAAPEVKEEVAEAASESKAEDSAVAEKEAAPEQAVADAPEAAAETAAEAAAAKEPAPKAAEPAKKNAAKKSNALTSAKEAGGSRGVPVAAGQTSRANTVSGSNSSPRSEKASEAAGGASSTVSLTSKEGATTSSEATVPSTPSKEIEVATTGSLSFKIKYENE